MHGYILNYSRLKGRTLVSSGFSTEGTLISASVVLHCERLCTDRPFLLDSQYFNFAKLWSNIIVIKHFSRTSAYLDYPLGSEIQTGNVAMLGTLTKLDIQIRAFLIIIFYAFIFAWTPNLLDIQEQCICKLGKIQSELNHLVGVDYWVLKLYTGFIWHSYCPSRGMLQRKGSGWSGDQVG